MCVVWKNTGKTPNFFCWNFCSTDVWTEQRLHLHLLHLYVVKAQFGTSLDQSQDKTSLFSSSLSSDTRFSVWLWFSETFPDSFPAVVLGPGGISHKVYKNNSLTDCWNYKTKSPSAVLNWKHWILPLKVTVGLDNKTTSCHSIPLHRDCSLGFLSRKSPDEEET